MLSFLLDRSEFRGVKMFAISFGNLCFNRSADREQGIEFVIAPKQNYQSLDHFVDAVFEFMNTDPEFADNYDEIYKKRIYEPVPDIELNFLRSRFSDMNNSVNIILEPFIRAEYLVKPRWNDITVIIETKSNYIFYNWDTTA